jgi:serine/threonine protein kinase
MTVEAVEEHWSVPAFLAELQKKYQADPNLRSSWTSESKALREILPIVIKELPNNYALKRPLGVGGSGIVAILHDKNLNTERALKLARPSPGKELLLTQVLLQETQSLMRLSHQNLIKIYAQGLAEYGENQYPFYVMDYVKGVLDSDEFLKQKSIGSDDVVQLLKGVFSAIEYLHDNNTIHMDIKPGNILVTPAGVPILSDLGFAKLLTTRSGQTLIGGTEGYIHPDARKFVEEAKSDPNRLRGHVSRTQLKPTWDLFSLGKTILKLLKILDDHNSKVLDSYRKRYLKLLACRLLDGHNNPDERAVGLSLATFKEIKYASIAQARLDLEKLTGEYNLEYRVPELNLHIPDTIQVSTLASTPFSKRVSSLLGHPVIMRLGRVSQLGLLNLVYPTATHSRLEHSLGTFSVLVRYLHALYSDPLNPLFKQIMDEGDFRAALLAGLLHDIGQYPLAHDLEDADEYGFSHTELGINILKDESLGLRQMIEQDWQISPDRVVAILEANPRKMAGELKDRILHSLIDGPLDADKIDYVMRDSIRLGLNYGKVIDLDRLLRTLTIVFREDDNQTYAVLGIHEKGKVSAESVAFARYAMFGSVYWHHAYRSIKAMLQRMVWDALANQKDDRARTGLRKDFQRFVYPKGRKDRASQQMLFSDSGGEDGFSTDVSQVQEGDLGVLGWIGEKSPTGKKIAELLIRRKLYKRVFVLSVEKQAEIPVWERFVEFRRRNKNAWQKMRDLQIEFQRRIISRVEQTDKPNVETAVVTADAKNKFLVSRAEPLLLIDIPPVRSNQEGLEYLAEEDRRRYKIDELKTGNFEKSTLWNELQQNSRGSLAKVRVFCDPEFSEFLTSYLTHTQIETELEKALSKIDTDA